MDTHLAICTSSVRYRKKVFLIEYRDLASSIVVPGAGNVLLRFPVDLSASVRFSDDLRLSETRPETAVVKIRKRKRKRKEEKRGRNYQFLCDWAQIWLADNSLMCFRPPTTTPPTTSGSDRKYASSPKESLLLTYLHVPTFN